MRDKEHPLHETLSLPDPEREMKLTAVNTKYSLIVHGCDREDKTEEEIQRNKKIIHTEFVKQTLTERPINTLINSQATDIHPYGTTTNKGHEKNPGTAQSSEEPFPAVIPAQHRCSRRLKLPIMYTSGAQHQSSV